MSIILSLITQGYDRNVFELILQCLQKYNNAFALKSKEINLLFPESNIIICVLGIDSPLANYSSGFCTRNEKSITSVFHRSQKICFYIIYKIYYMIIIKQQDNTLRHEYQNVTVCSHCDSF